MARALGIRRLAAAVAVTALAVALTGCNPDPTGGRRPPARGASVPAYTFSSWTLVRTDVPRTWRAGCPVHFSDLRGVRVAYWDYAGKRQEGNLVVHRTAMAQTREIFRVLYDTRFQVALVSTVERFGADDDRSMAANNTSAFNCRYVAGTTTWSEHSYGTAIDINPIQNPYVVGSNVYPPAGRSWTNRSSVTPGMITRGDAVWTVFRNYGWKWGGDWTTKKDFQHFSVTGR